MPLLSVSSSNFITQSIQPISPTHLETRWRIWRNVERTILEYETWFEPANTFLEYNVQYNTWYYIEVQFRDSYGFISEWSSLLSIIYLLSDICTPTIEDSSRPIVEVIEEASPIILTASDNCSVDMATTPDYETALIPNEEGVALIGAITEDEPIRFCED